MPIDLFPTDALMRAFDEPGSLLEDLDASGRKAAAAFDREPGDTREKVRAFEDVLIREPQVPRAVRRRLVKAMPAWWEAITKRAREGQLSSMTAELEAESLLGGDPSTAAPSIHPVLSYINEIGTVAAQGAFDAYRAALPPDALAPTRGTLLASEVFGAATLAGQEGFASSLAKRAGGDIFAFFEREAPPSVFWTTIVAGAAGALGTLIVGPKLLTNAVGAFGMTMPSINENVDVARISDRVKLRFGGSVRVLPGKLNDGPIWEQALDSAFGGGVRVGLRFDETFELFAGVEWAPEGREWGMKLTFTLLNF